MRKSQVEGSAWLFVLGEIWYDMGRVWGDVFLRGVFWLFRFWSVFLRVVFWGVSFLRRCVFGGYYFGRWDLGKSWKGIVQGLQKKCGWGLKLV